MLLFEIRQLGNQGLYLGAHIGRTGEMIDAQYNVEKCRRNKETKDNPSEHGVVNDQRQCLQQVEHGKSKMTSSNRPMSPFPFVGKCPKKRRRFLAQVKD